ARIFFPTKYPSTSTPSTILYQPKALKSCFLIYPIRNLIARMDTTQATTTPVTSIRISPEVNVKPNFKSYRMLTTNISSISRNNVNSAATVLDVPTRIPPMMVDPEREVPGITDSTWKTPIRNAVLKLISSREVQTGRRFLL